MRRYLALWLPFLPTDRLHRMACGAPDERPLVLVERQKGAQRLVAADRRARGLGLVPGLALADARARCPDLVARDHDPEADTALLEALAEDCLRWTPLVACDGPDGLTLDVTGCAHLAGGEAALREAVLGRLRRGRIASFATIAGTPDAARALVRFSRTALVPPGREREAVTPLPVRALGLDPVATRNLSRAGLKTIGALTERPVALLAARFGTGIALRLSAILGEADLRITPRRAPPACTAARIFAEPIARQEDIEAALRGLATELSDDLRARGEGGRRFEAAFFRSDNHIRRLAVETGRPTRDPALVLRLMHKRMEALADPLDPGFGFDAIRLDVTLAQPLDPAQAALDGRMGEEDEISALLDRLTVRFGRARVLRLAGRDTHDPGHAAQRLPATQDAPAIAWHAAPAEEPPSRPLHLFDPPQPVEALAQVPDGPPRRFRWRRRLHEVARAEGPERIAPEWWRDSSFSTRDYFRVETADGARFWLFRDGLYGGDELPRWYLHGLFP